ncbi:hypothetical protein CIB84_006099 [Bambusicola thoracicus]|uniref:G-protein coupled receptors family 1 profile domain-containing protein n=1 Tax=Bambusicola thoracicus TaxID=9083 RepID=A0A2P4T1B4_BAMTH|nr:hypothetical protein CIB84_006099 [Bambusicola thoracicus]
MAWIGNSSWFNHLALQEHFRRYLNSTEDYLAFLCGPKRSHLFLPMALVYSAIFVVGVIGNFLVCLVILKHQNMKTPTNYYLFSLAVSDLLVLLFGMPLEVYEMWSNYPFLFGPIGCYFKTALFETVCFASILSVTTVSIERYFAILHPFRAKLESTRKRALRTIVVLWVLSVLFALPNTGTHADENLEASATLQNLLSACIAHREQWKNSELIRRFNNISNSANSSSSAGRGITSS